MAAKKPVIKNPLDTYFKGTVGGAEYNKAIQAGWTADEVASYIFANYTPQQVDKGVESAINTNTNYNTWANPKNPIDTYFKGEANLDEYNKAIKAGWTADELANYLFANFKPGKVGPFVEKELKANTNYENWTKGTYTPTPVTPVKPVVTKTNHNLDATNAALFNKYVDDNPDLLQTWNAGEWQDKFASKADAGYDHWINNGKNEDRAILDVPKISYANGQLTLINKDYIGAVAQQKYNSIINTFNNSPGGNYKQLITALSNNLDPARVNDLFDTVVMNFGKNLQNQSRKYSHLFKK